MIVIRISLVAPSPACNLRLNKCRRDLATTERLTLL